MTKRIVEIWREGWGVLLDGDAVLRATPNVTEMLEVTWRGYMAYREVSVDE